MKLLDQHRDEERRGYKRLNHAEYTRLQDRYRSGERLTVEDYYRLQDRAVEWSQFCKNQTEEEYERNFRTDLLMSLLGEINNGTDSMVKLYATLMARAMMVGKYAVRYPYEPYCGELGPELPTRANSGLE